MATIAGLVVRIAGDTSGLRKEINAAQRQLNSAFGTKGMAFSKGLVKGMAAAGTAMGAMSGGKVGRGAIYGTALGGGLGLIKSIADKGDNVEIPQNAQLDLVLTQPITVSANTMY